MHHTVTFEEFCQQFTQEPIPHVLIGKRYFYDPHSLLKLAKEHKWDVFSVGLYLGEDKHGFKATSALVSLLADRSESRVSVEDKAAWLFVCNRDILMDGVLDSGNHRRDELVFVSDHHGNVLGYGEVMADYNPKMKNRQYVKHRHDKGEYLRRER